MSTLNCNTDDGVRVSSDDGKRCIGILQDGVLKRMWQSSKHLCRKYNAIGIDAGAFENLIERLAESVEVEDEDTGVCYRISVRDFRRYCIEDDLGCGAQVFCPIKYFEKTDPRQKGGRQLSFAFAGGE